MAEDNSTKPQSGVIDDLTGRVFARLTVIRLDAMKNHKSYWLCRCECGSETSVFRSSLLKGTTRSCGCLQRESRANRKDHGATKHGRSTPEYLAYRSMLNRCCNPRQKAYANYGARGITVCERWRGKSGFPNFLADMGQIPEPGYQLERSNNDGNYEPGNCRWATKKEQAQNRRNTRLITFNGETMCMLEWCRRLGVHHSTMHRRIKSWGLERALTAQKA